MIAFGTAMSELIDYCKFDAMKVQDRKEILEVIEVLYNQIHKGHLNIMEEENNANKKG